MTKPNQLQHTMTYYLFHLTSQTFDTMLSNHQFPSINCSWMKSPALHQCGSELPQSNWHLSKVPFFGDSWDSYPNPIPRKFSLKFPFSCATHQFFTRFSTQNPCPMPTCATSSRAEDALRRSTCSRPRKASSHSAKRARRRTSKSWRVAGKEAAYGTNEDHPI